MVADISSGSFDFALSRYAPSASLRIGQENIKSGVEIKANAIVERGAIYTSAEEWSKRRTLAERKIQSAVDPFPPPLPPFLRVYEVRFAAEKTESHPRPFSSKNEAGRPSKP